MAEKFRFEPDAQKDVQEAFDWYEAKEKGTGNKLLKEIKDKINSILKKPESRSVDEDGVRSANLKVFPYIVYYLFLPPVVVIVAVWHFSRTRDGWKKRITKSKKK